MRAKVHSREGNSPDYLLKFLNTIKSKNLKIILIKVYIVELVIGLVGAICQRKGDLSI